MHSELSKMLWVVEIYAGYQMPNIWSGDHGNAAVVVFLSTFFSAYCHFQWSTNKCLVLPRKVEIPLHLCPCSVVQAQGMERETVRSQQGKSPFPSDFHSQLSGMVQLSWKWVARNGPNEGGGICGWLRVWVEGILQADRCLEHQRLEDSQSILPLEDLTPLSIFECIKFSLQSANMITKFHFPFQFPILVLKEKVLISIEYVF